MLDFVTVRSMAAWMAAPMVNPKALQTMTDEWKWMVERKARLTQSASCWAKRRVGH